MGLIPKIWDHKALWSLLVFRAADTEVDEGRGEHGGVHVQLPIFADEGEVCVGGSLKILPQCAGQKRCLIHFCAPHLKSLDRQVWLFSSTVADMNSAVLLYRTLATTTISEI